MASKLTELEHFCPANPKEWRNWLKKNHQSEKGIWLVIHKKSSANPNLSWSEAVDEALCYGWIDSVKRSIDQEKYKQYFSKRKKESTWSKTNKEKVDILLAQNLMREAGLKTIEIAKENGSWTILDAVENLEVPKDLELELENTNGAADFFSHLSKSNKKQLLYWVVSAKRDETRKKRIDEIVQHAGQGQKPKEFR